MATSVAHVRVTTLFDSGATHSALNSSIGKQLIELGIKLEPCHINICDVQGNSLNVMGQLKVPITVHSKTNAWTVLVIDQLAEPLILGSDFMTANNISLSSMQCGMTCLV